NALDKPDNDLSETDWNKAQTDWVNARDAIAGSLAKALLGALAGIPGLAQLTADLTALQTEGVHGAFDLGPVHFEVGSTTLVLAPPILLGGVTKDPIEVGPYAVGSIAASMVSPFGGGAGMPGGGSVVRLPGGPDAGYGGTLQLPLGPVQVSATAVLA